jgi:hypothetical protein
MRRDARAAARSANTSSAVRDIDERDDTDIRADEGDEDDEEEDDEDIEDESNCDDKAMPACCVGVRWRARSSASSEEGHSPLLTHAASPQTWRRYHTECPARRTA